MNTLLVLCAVPVAVAAAARSTYSPCGHSMLSTMTPLAEKGRGHRFEVTATWFVVGAVAGGAALGALAAVLAAGVHALDPTTAVRIGAVALLALLGAAIDAFPKLSRLPHHRRQVDDAWLSEYRSWVYGGGFGIQIGAGLATYIMTAAVYLTVGLAAATGSPAVALGIGMFFGLCRGLAVWLARTITSPARLLAFHSRFAALAEPVRRLAIGTQAAVAVVLAGAAAGPIGALVVAAVAAVPVVAALGRRITPAASAAAINGATFDGAPVSG